MPHIYSAASLVEAQLIVDELAAGGMKARVTGTYLSGAIGELPPTDVIGVWLDESLHMERARALIDEYEAERRQTNLAWDCSGCGERIEGAFGACWQCGQRAPV